MTRFSGLTKFKRFAKNRGCSLSLGLACAAILGIATRTEAQVKLWNLPYTRPAAYDYSTHYDSTLTQYLTNTPTFFQTEMTKAWTYYKANFIIASGNGAGLVNHRRLENSQLIGTNEAVSEGQGYGLLLAVLNNDQPTFNKIFEAANQYMWDAGHKSYFKWTWPSNSSPGAATDADLDIALALVFADELQKKTFWSSYSGPVSYGARALELIVSIRQHMTASDQLLPGDNWGGAGIDNLNPSYFATAWLKVFNAYQTQVDFTPVINNCYSVLQKMPRYSLGQAPDWCTASGGQASQAGSKPSRGLGMLSDGIRTPYRIAMDALWFNDARAIQYCKNTFKTLTEYKSGNFRSLGAQMAHYNDQGVAVAETKGSFDNIAMWTTAVLGAKDPATTKPSLTTNLLGLIIGAGASGDHFGSASLQDDKFYFKQSLAMLGFAVIGGQFPNVLADDKQKIVSLFPDRREKLGQKAQSLSAMQNGVYLIPLQNDNASASINLLGKQLLSLP